MIEVNLIPDVKQELLKARRVRNMVVSAAVVVGAAAIGVVVLLALYVFGGQWAQNAYFDGKIADEQKKIQAISGASDLLTIQNQLEVLPQLHDSKHISSRLFSVLTTINPSAPNNINISKVTISAEDGTVAIEGQSSNGFRALETFQKTIQATKLEFMQEGSTDPITSPLATDLTTSDTSFGEDASGRRTLRFTITFTFSEELFARSSQQLSIVGPTKKNVTDSFVGIPDGLFTNRASDIEEEE